MLLPFDIAGAEDVEVGDPGFDAPLPEQETTPFYQSDPQGTLTVDAQACKDQLDALGDDAGLDNCCGGGPGFKCSNDDITKEQSIVTSGTFSVMICGDTPVCIGCAQLANYVEGIINTCSVNDEVEGSQELNQVDAFTVVDAAAS